MEGDTNSTTENVQLNANIIDDASAESLPPSNSHSDFVQQDDDNIKTSEPAADEIEAIVNQGNWTVKKILGVRENQIPSILISVDQDTTTISSSSIVEMNSIITSSDVQPCTASLTNHPESRMNATTTDNCQQELQKRKHIMISYNHATASTVCRKICDRLRGRNKNVWFDTTNFTHGSVNDALGEAVDNAYVVLACMNEGYSKSKYCLGEVKYAIEKEISVIPCMMEERFRPCGGLGFIKSDLKHIKFFDEDKFDESFEELITAINAIEARSVMGSVNIVPVSDMDFRNRFNAFIAEHILSIENCHLRRDNLDENEFGTVLRRLIQEFSPGTLQSFEHDQSDGAVRRQIQESDNDRLIQHLLKNDKKLAELAQLQQENNARIQQHLLDQDERLTALLRLQPREQENVRLNHNEHLMSLFRIQDMQQQGQEQNDRISGQLLQHIKQLTELVINQQQQHARDTESLHQLINRSLENNESLKRDNDQGCASPDTQQQQGFHFNFNIFKELIQTIVLLWTLLILLRDK